MAKRDSQHDSTSGYTFDIAQALPYVGQVVAVLARQALRSNEQDAVRSCLEEALRPADARVGWRGALQTVRHPWLTRAAKRARRQAALDIAAVANPTDLGVRDQTEIPSVTLPSTALPGTEHTKVGASGVQAGASTEREAARNQTLALGQFVTSELQKATEAERFIPWTGRVSGVLGVGAQNAWEQRAKRIGQIDEALAKGRRFGGVDASDLRKERELHCRTVHRLHAAVLNRTPVPAVPSTVPEQPSEDEFEEFGDRVGLRLISNMACHDQLQILVRRLDKQDGQRAEAALVTAVQGLRVAVLSVAAILVVTTLTLIDLTLR